MKFETNRISKQMYNIEDHLKTLFQYLTSTIYYIKHL